MLLHAAQAPKAEGLLYENMFWNLSYLLARQFLEVSLGLKVLGIGTV